MNLARLYYLLKHGRLAQLVEHIVDVDGVRGSSPLPPTKRVEKFKFSEFSLAAAKESHGFVGTPRASRARFGSTPMDFALRSPK